MKTKEKLEVPTGAELLARLSKDVKLAGATLGKDEARFLVDLYYQIQDFRIATSGQIRSITKLQTNEPHQTLAFFTHNFEQLENDIKSVLDVYTDSSKVGAWCKSICGIGPVITAGLLSYIDIEQAPTAGHIWAYGGYDPTRQWLGTAKSTELYNEVIGDKKNIDSEDIIKLSARSGWKVEYLEKNGRPSKKKADGTVEYSDKYTKTALIKAMSFRPYNSHLKTLFWKIGQSFIKVSNNEQDIYGKIYKQRKAYEIVKNESGCYKQQADDKLVKFNIGKDTEAYKAYSVGKLPDAQITQRSARYATKIFLSHLHRVMYLDHFNEEPPKPFAIAILGHAHEIECPNLQYIK